MKLSNTVVLITGANRGLGRALVEASLAAGARRIYAASRDPRQVEAAARTAPDRIVPIALDVTDPRSIEAAVAQAGDVALLINNAGVLASYQLLASEPHDIARDFAVNLYGMLATTRAFVPALARAAAAGAGAVVNVLSVVSFANVPALGGYSASKAAAFSATQALRGELAPRRIAVHAAFPAGIDTDMARSLSGPKSSPARVARGILDGIEAGREDIAPDPTSQQIFELWQRDPKALERQLGALAV